MQLWSFQGDQYSWGQGEGGEGGRSSTMDESNAIVLVATRMHFSNALNVVMICIWLRVIRHVLVFHC